MSTLQGSLGLLAGYFGFGLLLWRLKPWLPWGQAPPEGLTLASDALSRVSVILPVRNEASNLTGCIASLLTLGAGEIIVVDDQSTDTTALLLQQLATQYPQILALTAPAKPEGWLGKSWACQIGAERASGAFLLFTDADTRHLPGSLQASLQELNDSALDLLSALPYHASETLWERLMSPLQLIALAVTAPFDRPKPRRLYAIGQYLLFRREAYQHLGGHAARKGALAEDLHFARECLQQQLNYGVSRQRFYEVRMYATLAEFLAGWRRLCLLGLDFSSPWAGPEVILYYLAFSGGAQLGLTPASAGLIFLMVWLCWLLQPRLGRFSLLGPLLFPLALGCFALATGLSLCDRLRGSVSWRGRRYNFTSGG